MNIEDIREYSLSLPNVTEDQPFGDDIIVFRIGGKIFLCLWLGGGRYDMIDAQPRFALKLTPERNIELREEHQYITPAWHCNKRHWSDIFYEHFSRKQLMEWIMESYQLVLSTLPKALQAKYLLK